MATLLNALGLQDAGSNKVAPITSADSFFGKPELMQQQLIENYQPTKCSAGVLALRVPDPPAYAPPSVCAISKNGKIAAVGGKDVELFLWDTETGELLSTLRGHETVWTSSNDNTFFVTVQEDSKVYVWDQEQLRQRQLLGHPDEPITCCSISQDDQYVVIGGARGTVYSWDSDSGVEYRQYEEGHVGPVSCVMCYVMPEGNHVIISCGAADHTVVVWDLEEGSKKNAVLIDELEHAKNVKYHVGKDGMQVVAWCTDSVPFPNLVYVDALTGAKNSVFCHDGLIRHAVFGKDGSTIISCGSDGKIVVWESTSLDPQITITGHVGSVLCCGINEEGTRIISSGEDCTVRMWSAEDGMQLMMMQAQDEPIKYCAFAKGVSSNKILTCDFSGRVYVWNIISEVIASLLRRFADNISAVAMSNDCKLLVAGANNGRVMMWDVEMRENIWEYSHHTGRVECVAFNALRDLVATCGADGRLSIVAADSGKQVNAFNGTDEPMMQLAFSPDDEKVAGVTADGKLLIFFVGSTARTPQHILSNDMGSRVTHFTWSPNSKLIVGVCTDGSAMVWNTTTGAVFTVLEGAHAATCCTFDVVGKLLAVGNVLGRTVLYNLETSEQLCELRSNASAVVDVMFNADTSRLTTVCSRQAIVWDAATTQKIRVFDFVLDKSSDFVSAPHLLRSTCAHSGTILFDHESEAVIFDMAPVEDPLLKSFYLSDSRMISCGQNSHRRVMVWSAAGNNAPDAFHTTHDAITSCHFSLDDRLVALGTQDGNVIVYDVVHNETVEVINAHQNGPCRCVKLNADNSVVLSCGADAKVILWDWKARHQLRIFSGHFISIGSCDIASNDSRVVSGDNHGMICVYEKETGNTVQTMPLAHSKAILSVSISADGSSVASVGADDKVSIWNVDDGQELVSLSPAIESHPLYCAFSSDGNKLAVTESNGSVMVWNTFAGCQWYTIPHAHNGKVTGCSWSFDCRRFVTCGTDSTMAVWDAESGAPMFKFPVKTGALTSVAASPSGTYVAGGSVTGTLSVCSVPMASRQVPEPSFLYNWLASKEPQQAARVYTKLLAQHPHIANVQDAQGWSLINHMVAKGNATVSTIVLESAPQNVGSLGLISAVPFSISTRVRFHGAGEEGFDAEGNPIAIPIERMGTSAKLRIAASSKSFTASMRSKSFVGGAGGAGAMSMNNKVRKNGSIAEEDEDDAVAPSTKSFTQQVSQQVKKVAVELFTEKRQADHLDLIMNNALALALNSKSSECVQVVLDATASNKVTWGSYHAITDMMPSLAIRYPYMCYQFLAQLELAGLGDLEVPVAVMRGLDRSVIRTAPIYTNVRNLWQSHLKLHEVRHGPQPYAHVKASMVRLPFACSVGKDSILQSLVESDVPVQTYGTPTIKSIIRHKWRLYARSKLVVRASVYFFYTLVFTVFAILFAMENHSLSLSEYWKEGPGQKYHLISGGYCLAQGVWLSWGEVRQLSAIGATLYFQSGWNFLDIVSSLLVIVITSLHFARTSSMGGEALGPLIAFEVILVWFKLFFYALAFEPTGPVVHRFFQITYAIRGWATLLFMNLVAFGASLMVLYQYTPSEDFLDFGRALYSLYNALFGVYSMDVNITDGSWKQLAIIFWAGFLFMCNIVLLNMLIALMRDIYHKVCDTEQDVFLRGRAALIVEVETLMSTAQLEEHMLAPPYVHMLTEVQRKVHNSDSLLGRLDRLEALVSHLTDSFGQLLRSHGIRPMHSGGSNGVVVPRGLHEGGTAAEAGLAAVAGAAMSAMHQGPGMPGMPGVPGAPGMPGLAGAPGMDAQAQLMMMMANGGHMPGGEGGAGAGAMMNPMMMMGNPMMMGGGGMMNPMMMMGGGGMMNPMMMMGGGGMYGGLGGMMTDPITGAPMNMGEQANLIQMTAQRLKDNEAQMPAILRQIDRVQRTLNNQEMRLEGVVIVLRDIENLLRNQQPVIIHQETRPPPRKGAVLTEAELELEVKRLLGKTEAKL